MAPPVLNVIVYCAWAILLIWGGNLFCRIALSLSNIPFPSEDDGASPASGKQKPAPRAGRIIGALERLLITLGLAVGSWEVIVAVVALKTVARYKELDKQIEAEYFLVGSLASLFWAIVISGLMLWYDRTYGLALGAAIALPKSD